MAIFTKDGKTYTVVGPNPLVEKQTSWDPSKLVFHNFEWDEISHRASRAPQSTRAPKEEAKVAPQAVAPPPPPEPETTEQQTEEEPAETTAVGTEEAEPREFDLPYIKYKVLCHCLPAKMEERKDSFYGESWGRIRYGKKFVFPCVVVSAGDLALEFWTSDPREQISEKSVIYPFSYEVHNQGTDSHDRVPYDDYRWWRVSSKERKEGGWLFRANPSDFQPDFSD